jgi:dinuclear metal center YbgI/SA1388 family protein
MAATIGDLVRIMEDIAPPELALPDDRIGLQVGDLEAHVKSALVALDASDAVIARALSSGASVVLVHHPLIHEPVDRIVRDDPVGRRLLDAARAGVAVYVAHTNLDRAPRGVNTVLGETIGLRNAEPLQVEEGCPQYKLVVFVPKGYADAVRIAACSAGAGVIGDYTFCTFQTEGVGTFVPAQSAQPFSGKVGNLNRAEELRLEMVVSAPFVRQVVEAIGRAHPYEEVAYDLLVTGQRDSRFSLGRIGELEEKVTLEEFAAFVKKVLKLAAVRVVGNKRKKLRRVATVAGGGARYLSAAAGAGADVLVTGDVGYHHAREAAARGLCLIDASHEGTEGVILEPLASLLRAELEKLDQTITVETIHEPGVFAVL